jgi:hypothetical protein
LLRQSYISEMYRMNAREITSVASLFLVVTSGVQKKQKNESKSHP